MNNNKIGQPYLYPDSLIEFLSILYVKSFDYRSLEGILSGLSQHLNHIPVISFSQIRRRIKRFEPKFKPRGNHLMVGTDGTGIKVTNRGEWMRQKWKIRRGWIKVVLMGDAQGNVVDVRIGDENLNENSSGRGMLRTNKKYVDKFIGDGLYYTIDNFKLCSRLGVEPVIKIRDDASTRARGCMARKRAVIEYKKLGYKKWTKEKQYGMRWPATEGIFSSTKRMFGEYVRSHKKRAMYHEAKLKFWVYQQVKDCK
jgi:hypothetical protein